MESVGEKPIDKKKWVILFLVLGILIVGLIIAIVVVLVVRNNGSSEIIDETNQGQDEAVSAYLDDNGEIATAIVEQKLDGEGMLKLLKEKIDSAENEKTKAMLEQDYYMTMFAVYGADDGKKDEMLNGLIKVDEILQTANSSESVASVALAYHDFDLYQKYVDISKNRDPDYKSIYDIVEKGQNAEN